MQTIPSNLHAFVHWKRNNQHFFQSIRCCCLCDHLCGKSKKKPPHSDNIAKNGRNCFFVFYWKNELTPLENLFQKQKKITIKIENTKTYKNVNKSFWIYNSLWNFSLLKSIILVWTWNGTLNFSIFCSSCS